jgi:hypothetical protein
MTNGLDHRHRRKDGEISRKHGNTKIRTLRKIYGAEFAEGHPDEETLATLLHELDEPSLSKLVRDHEAGLLENYVRKES